MAETTKMAASEIAAEHATEAHAPYLKVFAGLAVLTAIEYYYAAIFKDHFGDPAARAALPGRDQGGHGRLVLHAPEVRGQLGVYHDRAGGDPGHVLTMALCPDMVLKYETEENPGEDSAYVLARGRADRGMILASRTGEPPCV